MVEPTPAITQLPPSSSRQRHKCLVSVGGVRDCDREKDGLTNHGIGNSESMVFGGKVPLAETDLNGKCLGLTSLLRKTLGRLLVWTRDDSSVWTVENGSRATT